MLLIADGLSFLWIARLFAFFVFAFFVFALEKSHTPRTTLALRKKRHLMLIILKKLPF